MSSTNTEHWLESRQAEADRAEMWERMGRVGSVSAEDVRGILEVRQQDTQNALRDAQQVGVIGAQKR